MPKLNVDFTGADEGFKLPEEGSYICKVKSIVMKEGQKARYLQWELIIGVGPDKGTKVLHNTSLSPNALFNLRNTLIACGLDVPATVFQVNTDACVGAIVGIELGHREYEKDGQKKKSAQVNEIYRVAKVNGKYVKADEAAKKKVDEVPFEEDSKNVSNNSEMEDDDEEIDI